MLNDRVTLMFGSININFFSSTFDRKGAKNHRCSWKILFIYVHMLCRISCFHHWPFITQARLCNQDMLFTDSSSVEGDVLDAKQHSQNREQRWKKRSASFHWKSMEHSQKALCYSPHVVSAFVPQSQRDYALIKLDYCAVPSLHCNFIWILAKEFQKNQKHSKH